MRATCAHAAAAAGGQAGLGRGRGEASERAWHGSVLPLTSSREFLLFCIMVNVGWH
jgi:hypothetical protein